MTMTIDQMVTEDQRNVAVNALNEIVRRTDKVTSLTEEELAEMEVADLFNMLSGTLAVLRFNAHSALDSIERMETMR